jgi:hypothetical protein
MDGSADSIATLCTFEVSKIHNKTQADPNHRKENREAKGDAAGKGKFGGVRI